MNHYRPYSPGVPVGALIRALFVALVLGAAGVGTATVDPVLGIALVLLAIAICIGLLQADTTNVMSGAEAMSELHNEIALRTIVLGERLMPRVPTERSLTRS